jgi:hypothetical protein
MDTDSGGTGTAPAPHGRVSSRASSALAAFSILAILLYLIWRFIWQCRKHGTRSDSTGATVSPPTSSARQPSCPSTRDATAAYGAGEAARRTPRTATTTSPLSVLVRVAAARLGRLRGVPCGARGRRRRYAYAARAGLRSRVPRGVHRGVVPSELDVPALPRRGGRRPRRRRARSRGGSTVRQQRMM